jgi:hypothetical protein
MLPPDELYLQQRFGLPNEEGCIISVAHEHDVAYVNDFIYSTHEGNFIAIYF